MGECWLVPFNNSKIGAKLAVFIIGYKGMINICERSRCDVIAYPVFQGDTFSYHYGDDPRIFHTPAADNLPQNKDTLTHAYAVATLRTKTKKRLVLTRAQIDRHKARSRGADKADSPWNHQQDFIPMAMKTAVRALFPQLPKTTDMARALDSEIRAELGEPTAVNHEVYDEEFKLHLPQELQEPEDKRSALDKLAEAQGAEGTTTTPPTPPVSLTDDDIKWG
jgi:recombination protein RecT